MRSFLVTIVLALASCGSPAPTPPSGYDANGCKIGCDKCPPQTLCVGLPYIPVCVQQCQTQADCDSGICSIIGTTTAGPRVCFGGLMLCEPTTCDNTPQCLADGVTQLKPLPTTGGVCGWQVLHCDSGCDSATGSCK